MDQATLSSVMTVVSFATFLGIVAWAWSARRKSAFDAAAREPFALPDEFAGNAKAQQRGQQ